ncbi:MAG TPA: hypothetical protein VLA74_13665, partial [Nitrososphaeraceae archaeon]|nr:hypothetical protein [Nitrososphaeraceae archaeon]
QKDFWYGSQSNRASVLGSVLCSWQCFKLPLISENPVALINDQLKEFGNANDISKMADDICISSPGFNKVLRNF